MGTPIILTKPFLGGFFCRFSDTAHLVVNPCMDFCYKFNYGQNMPEWIWPNSCYVPWYPLFFPHKIERFLQDVVDDVSCRICGFPTAHFWWLLYVPWSKDDQRVTGELDLVPHKRCILFAKNIWSQDEEVQSGVIILGTLYSVFVFFWCMVCHFHLASLPCSSHLICPSAKYASLGYGSVSARVCQKMDSILGDCHQPNEKA